MKTIYEIKKLIGLFYNVEVENNKNNEIEFDTNFVFHHFKAN